MRKLAEESQESTHQIENLILEIQESSKEAATTVDKAQNLIQVSVDESLEVRDQFTTISDILSSMNDMIQSINERTEEQTAAAGEVADTMTEIATSSQTTASETEQITAEVQEQLSGFNIISDNISMLSNSTKDLEDQVEEFKTKK